MPDFYYHAPKCVHCGCPCPTGFVVETEPSPDAKVIIYCPMHGGPIPFRFHDFRKVDELPPGVVARPYPPPTPSSQAQPATVRWQFWKW